MQKNIYRPSAFQTLIPLSYSKLVKSVKALQRSLLEADLEKVPLFTVCSLTVCVTLLSSKPFPTNVNQWASLSLLSW